MLAVIHPLLDAAQREQSSNQRRTRARHDKRAQRGMRENAPWCAGAAIHSIAGIRVQLYLYEYNWN